MKTAVVFPGQGSQSVGMGKDFFEQFAESKALFEEADKVLGYSLSEIIFNGPDDELKLTANTQPALLLISSIIWEHVKKKVEASYFAGHSLGEYSALVAAGGLTLSDALLAVHNRGKYMQSAVPVGVGAMAAVLMLELDKIAEVCASISKEGHKCEVANINSPGQIVIAGHKDAVEKASEALKQAGAKRCVPLPVSAPFHSSLMEPARVAMQEYLSKVQISDLHTPVINNIDAKEETSASEVRDSLVRQVTGSVRWVESVERMVSLGVTRFVEVGAGSVLSGLIKKINSNVEIINISTVADLEKI